MHLLNEAATIGIGDRVYLDGYGGQRAIEGRLEAFFFDTVVILGVMHGSGLKSESRTLGTWASSLHSDTGPGTACPAPLCATRPPIRAEEAREPSTSMAAKLSALLREAISGTEQVALR